MWSYLPFAARLPLWCLTLIPLWLCSPAQAQSLAPEIKPAVTTLIEAGTLERAGRYAEALPLVEKAIAEEPDQLRPLFLKGVILMDLNRLEEAAALFQQLRERFPEVPEPYNNLAVILMRQGRFESARVALETAVVTYPDFVIAQDNLASVYASMAADALAKAVAKDPANTPAQRKLALLRQVLAPAQEAAKAPDSGKANRELERR